MSCTHPGPDAEAALFRAIQRHETQLDRGLLDLTRATDCDEARAAARHVCKARAEICALARAEENRDAELRCTHAEPACVDAQAGANARCEAS